LRFFFCAIFRRIFINQIFSKIFAQAYFDELIKYLIKKIFYCINSVLSSEFFWSFQMHQQHSVFCHSNLLRKLLIVWLTMFKQIKVRLGKWISKDIKEYFDIFVISYKIKQINWNWIIYAGCKYIYITFKILGFQEN
jgi:hypothetical protein